MCSVAMSADADLEPAAACKRKEKLSRILGLGDEWDNGCWRHMMCLLWMRVRER